MWFEVSYNYRTENKHQKSFFPIKSLLPTTSLPVIINLYEYHAPLEIYMPKKDKLLGTLIHCLVFAQQTKPSWRQILRNSSYSFISLDT